jgi:hypothetical protein
VVCEARTVNGGNGRAKAVESGSGTVAILGYATTWATDPIWKGRPWSTTAKHRFDAVSYGLFTSGVFGWLWPYGGMAAATADSYQLSPCPAP